MSQDFVLFERQADGSYKRSGELPKGTRFALVEISAGEELHVVKRAKDWLEILSRGPLKQAWYKVVPADNPKPMSEDAKEKLRELNRRKKEELEAEEETV